MNGVNGVKKRAITRNRETLTCLPCRSRKLKCDKAFPCGSCTKRNDSESCTYAKTGKREIAEPNGRAGRAEARLQHLEHLVQNLVRTSDRSAGTLPEPPVNEAGPQTNNGSEDYFVGPTHYAAILEDIEDLRQVLSEDLETGSSPPPINEAIAAESDVLFGGTPRLSSISAILTKYLPPKAETDRRVAAYFRAEAVSAPFIHVPQFLRQYEEFWKNPSKTSPLWVSILFSVCELSQCVGRGAGLIRPLPSAKVNDSNGHTFHAADFSLAAAHCLALGRYTRPQKFAVEALGIYIQARVIGTLDPSRDIGILFGTLLQIAYTMGYHRDPDHFPNIGAFEGEMRRRSWSYCMQLDLLVSFQLGLPNNSSLGSWDSRMPCNLKDTDFDESVPVLPQPRPAAEPTKITFYTSKHMLMGVFDKILKHALSAGGLGSENELLTLDAELHAAYHSIPAVYHYRSVELSLADPSYLIVTRKCVELMFQKCLCVLHRKHVTSGRSASVRKCHDASIALVKAFLELYPELKVGGQFYEDRWLLGSISWNDFLLGVMVLCLVLCQYRRSPMSVPSMNNDQTVILKLLKESYEVCLENVAASLGARRTCRLLESLFAQNVDSGGWHQLDESTENSAASQDAPNSQTHSGQQADMQTDSEIFAAEFNMQDFNNGDTLGWNDPWANVFDTQEWEFLEQCLNTNFDTP